MTANNPTTKSPAATQTYESKFAIASPTIATTWPCVNKYIRFGRGSKSGKSDRSFISAKTCESLMHLKASIVLAAVLALSVGSAASAHAQVNEENAEFLANIEFIRGHLGKAIENKNMDNTELALAHAGHPVEEVYSLIEGEIEEHDEALNAELEEALVTLANEIDTMAAADVETAVADINGLMDQAVEAVVGDADAALWARASMLILETAELEYGEGVAEGEIVEEIEYQDGTAFISRAAAIFEAIKADMPEHEAEEVEELFAELDTLTSSNGDPAAVAIAIGGINHEYEEVFGLEGKAEELGGWEYIDRIKELLDQSVHEYEEGEFDEARALAREAYLDNYEFIEGDIAEDDPELMEKIELDMREELVQMIDDRRPLAEIEAHVDQIKSDLEVARAVTTPEFPVAALAASLGIAGTIAYARIRGLGRRA